MMTQPRRSCVFILTHGRPDNVITLRTLKACGYTGDWFIVIDDMDATADRYIENFGRDRMIVFDKRAVAQTFDTADLSTDYRSVVFARNVAFDLARERGYTHFVEMDDDYNIFRFRYEDETGLRDGGDVRNLDAAFEAMYDFLDESDVSAVAFGQRGDLIGGAEGHKWKNRPPRKMMNAIFCRASDEWRFLGRVNEDVNTYTTLSTRGHVFLSIMEIVLNQTNTQKTPGWMTDLYRASGTYQKTFYTVMMCPSAARVDAMASNHTRIHHRVSWNNCTPKILSEAHRKYSMHTGNPHA